MRPIPDGARVEIVPCAAPEIGVREAVESGLQHQVMHDPLTVCPAASICATASNARWLPCCRDPATGSDSYSTSIVSRGQRQLGHLAVDVVRRTWAPASPFGAPTDVVAPFRDDSRSAGCAIPKLPQCRISSSPRWKLREVGRSGDPGGAARSRLGRAYGIVDEVFGRDAACNAKSAGRNRFVLFDDTMHQAAMNGLELEQELRHALAHSEFVPYYQPLVQLDDATVVGYEALLRWRHPQRGMLAPGDFLAAAEDSGLIEPIDWRMFLDAAGRAQRHRRMLRPHVSSRMFQRISALRDWQEAGFNPAQLRIESPRHDAGGSRGVAEIGAAARGA